MCKLAAYIRARAAFKLFMFDGTLCTFGIAFRRFASHFQMTGTIICNNHCSQTIFPRVGKMDFCPPPFQNERLCSGVTGGGAARAGVGAAGRAVQAVPGARDGGHCACGRLGPPAARQGRTEDAGSQCRVREDAEDRHIGQGEVQGDQGEGTAVLWSGGGTIACIPDRL